MTANDWQTASEPQAMLEHLQNSGSVSNRKLRLFAVACSRRIWPLIDGLGRNAVEVAERFADKLASSKELRAARLVCQGASDQAAWYAAASNPVVAARNAARSAQIGVANNISLDSEAAEHLAQAQLLREIFGNPFQPFSVHPSWLTPDVVELARAIYDDRAFDKMPSLVGALEKAGCHDGEVLRHCRRLGAHVRGCWIIDLLLCKE